MRRRRKRSPAASSCWDPWGCRMSVTPMKSKGPERKEDIRITLSGTAVVSCDGHPTKARSRLTRDTCEWCF